MEVEIPVPEEAIEVHDGHVGPGYAVPTPAMRAAVELLARTEGVLLDPVYTGKAMAGLIDLVRCGAFRANQNAVFLHTGGVPALFCGRPKLHLLPRNQSLPQGVASPRLS